MGGDKLVAHIEKHENDLLVRQAILGKGLFSGAVEDFYDLLTWKKYGLDSEYDAYDLRQDDRRKRGKDREGGRGAQG